jgi:hypothetical protein
MAGGGDVGAGTTSASAVGEPVEPYRDPAGAPVAGCGWVVVVVAAGAGVVATVAGGTVGVGTVVTGGGTVDVVVAAGTVVVGHGAVVVVVVAWVRCVGVECPPAKAATVPPRAPNTTAMATPVTTKRRFMRGCYASLNNRRSTARQRSR